MRSFELLPLEDELAAESESLLAFSNYYLTYAQNIRNHFGKDDSIAAELENRGRLLGHNGRLKRAISILTQPNPDPKLKEEAKIDIWLEKLNKRVTGLIPSSPSNRAHQVTFNGKDSWTPPTEQEIQNFKKSFPSLKREAWEKALQILPDPKGRLLSFDDFLVTYNVVFFLGKD